MFVSARVGEEPQQEDERACQEDPIISTISLDTTTEDVERFVSFPSWEGKDIVDLDTHTHTHTHTHIYIGIDGHIRYTFDLYDILYLMYDTYLMYDIIRLMTLLVNI